MKNNSVPKKIVIVGGVAGGANVAARLRRLDESCQITMYERGGHVSFANCGLPYHIGGEIEKREKLLIHTPYSLRERFAIDAKVNSEVISIDRVVKEVTVKNLVTGETSTDPYDTLVLSPGAAPLRPQIPGIDLPGIFSLRDIKDMDSMISHLESHAPSKVIIVGGGFIGLEMAEQLYERLASRDVKITLLESNPQVLTPLDAEMAVAIEEEIRSKGIELRLGDPVVAFRSLNTGINVETKNGAAYSADFVIFNVGVRPEVSLAVKAGLEIGQRGGIKVDSQLRTSDPNIFALGDCVETINFVTGELGIIPLAGPANRQGRIVADVIAGRNAEYKGTLGTAIVRVFELTAAITGVNEKTLRRLGLEYQAIYLHPTSHASYYPGAKTIHLKLLFSPTTGKILGAQAVGKEGVDKRIDVLATAIYSGLNIDELSDLELCYAPPFGSAKDPVNLAGMVAQNIRAELVQVIAPLDFKKEAASAVILDVRDSSERALGYIPSSIHIPLSELRNRLGEIPAGKPLIVYCQSGQRSYNACRILSQRGFDCKNLSGAYNTWKSAEKVLK